MPHSDDPTAARDLRHYLDVLWRRKWIVLSVVAVAVAVAAASSLLRDSVYRAEAKIVVGQGNTLFRPGEANAIEPFTATMSDLAHSNLVAQRVIEQAGLPETPEELLASMNVSFNPDTAVLNVEVLDHDPQVALKIANTVGTVFSQLISERFGEASGSAPETPLTATVWGEANVDAEPVSPKPKRDIAAALVLGFVLGGLAAFLREYFDRTLRSREAVEKNFGVPVIGQIPFGPKRDKGSIAAYWSGFREGAESFRALRANLQYLAVQRPLRTILVASASPEQGKTTVAANLAVAMAQSGARPVVVEADLRRPRLHEVFGFDPRRPAGLTSVLVGAADLDEALLEIAIPGGDPALGEVVTVLPSGPLPPNPSELLSSAQMELLLDQLAERFDYVLVDSPPILLVADALQLSRVVDGAILVVRRNKSTTDEAQEVRSMAERLDINLLGAVFSDSTPLASYYGAYGDPDSKAPLAGAGRAPAQER
jgi:capsular exopolysaccharide synthesis family protein